MRRYGRYNRGYSRFGRVRFELSPEEIQKRKQNDMKWFKEIYEALVTASNYDYESKMYPLFSRKNKELDVLIAKGKQIGDWLQLKDKVEKFQKSHNAMLKAAWAMEKALQNINERSFDPRFYHYDFS